MTRVRVNGVDLFVEETGVGEPLVLAHGSWGDHHNWDLVVPMLAQRYRVITYDRRGHSLSERPTTQGSFNEDADDLAALIKELGIAPALVVGNSGGSIIALKTAIRHPETVKAIAAHEPPAMQLLENLPELAEALDAGRTRIEAVAALLAEERWQEGAKLFANTLAIGPDAWDSTMAPQMRDTFVRNAPTFWDELHDEDGLTIDLDALARFDRPILLTAGTESAPFFIPVAELIARQVPSVRTEILQGADHIPHLTDPAPYVERITGFLATAP